MRATNAHPPIELPANPAGATPAPNGRMGALGRGFRALSVRNYRLYWFGQLISQTGSWMQTTAQSWLVLQLTQSPFALGVVTALQFLPIMLLSLLGGAIGDRLPKHRLIIFTQTAALIQAVIFAALVGTGAIQLWHVYILAAVQGVITGAAGVRG